jgi:hypothetical protein
MAQIHIQPTQMLTEHRTDISGLKRKCEDFKCEDVHARCCIWQILGNQPDFVNIKSILETHCEARGFKLIFLPKFHCELNCLEQCWGMAKQHYCSLPRSKGDHKATLDS